jgi:hypothetical protein
MAWAQAIGIQIGIQRILECGEPYFQYFLSFEAIGALIDSKNLVTAETHTRTIVVECDEGSGESEP